MGKLYPKQKGNALGKHPREQVVKEFIISCRAPVFSSGVFFFIICEAITMALIQHPNATGI